MGSSAGEGCPHCGVREEGIQEEEGILRSRAEEDAQ